MCTRSCARANDAKIVCSRDAQCNTKAPAKRSQHANATYRNIVGRNMLRAFGHRVAMCCDMLGVVGSGLKMVKFEPTTPNTSQHVATGWPNARNKLRPTMLRSFGRGLSSRPLLLRISSAHARATSFSSARSESKTQQNTELMTFALTWCANVF